MGRASLYNGRAGLAVMLSTREVHGDLYDSTYELPIPAHSFSTERKLVHKGEGPALERFLAEPVHTGPNHAFPPTHSLPRWVHDAVAAQIVEGGRSRCAYTLELVGIGEPSVGWVLQRLKGRRAQRYDTSGPLHGLNREQLRERADDFQLVYWCHDIHFVLRMNAFAGDDALNAWLAQHPRTSHSIDRPRPPVVSQPATGLEGLAWFEAMGAYAPPRSLSLDDDAGAFAFRKLSNWALAKAYWNRGPDNPIVNILNWPLEAYRLAWDQCPQGTVLTKFRCDLRFEAYG